MDTPHAELLEFGRERLAAGGVSFHLAHLGVPWRWCLEARTDGLDTVIAYLVPEPKRPQLAIPMPEDSLHRLSLKRLSKPVRDGLLHARLVGGVIWAEWDLNGRPLTTELCDLALAKRAALAQPAGV